MTAFPRLRICTAVLLPAVASLLLVVPADATLLSSTTQRGGPPASAAGSRREEDREGDPVAASEQDRQACADATEALLASSDSLVQASADFTASMETKVDDPTDMSVGFPSDAVDLYRAACHGEEGLWMMLDGEHYACTIQGHSENVLVYGMGFCWANTTECASMDPIIFVEDVWQTVGMECTAADADGVSANPGDEGDSENEAGDSPADAEDAFLSPEDASCLDSTDAFVSGKTALLEASSAYMQGAMINLDDTNGMSMGFSLDSVEVMQAACDKAGHGGYWSMIESEDFICDKNGVELTVNVYNFGACLADVDDCYAMDMGHLLETSWEGMGLTCWNRKDPEEIPADELENAEDLGLSVDDATCLYETDTLVEGSTALADASMEFAETMDVNIGDGADDEGETTMGLGFPDEAVDKLRAACDDAGGFFSLVESMDYVCDMMGTKNNLEVTNVANCFANTNECKNMDPMQLMEDVWQAMGLKCTEAGKVDADDDNDSDGSPGDESSQGSENTSENGDESNPEDEEGSSGGGDPDEDAEVDALGLTTSDVKCMHDSAGFVRKSDAISDASVEYQKSVEMNDPKKLGFPADAAANMEAVCEEEGGFWSFVDSEYVVCDINGHSRRINVYNFGNCVAKTDACQAMDPIVLVKGFFYEIMNFRCQKWSAADGSGIPATSSPGSSSSSYGATTPAATEDDDMHPTAIAAIVLCLVVVVGFFAFYRIRNSQGRERISRRAYEMTDVSDLRFDTLT